MASFVKGNNRYLVADAEHPVSSALHADGTLAQMGISAEGFQREINVHRYTNLPDTAGRYTFHWELHLYMHPGIRHVIPLSGMKRSGKGGVPPMAPADVRRMSEALHRMALAGYDPRKSPASGGGWPRGMLWHRIMLYALCAHSLLGDFKRALHLNGLSRKNLGVDLGTGVNRA